MIEAARFLQGISEPEPVDTNDLAHARAGKGTLLIVDAVNFTEAELEQLAAQLPIHPLVLDDLRNANQRTKLERYGDHWHVAVHAADVHDDRLFVKEVDVVFGEDWLLSVSQPVEGGEPMDLAEVKRRFTRARLECENDDLGCALWALLDVIVDGYFTVTDLVDERLNDIEEIVFGAGRRDAIPQEVFTLRRSLVQFRRAAAPLREVIATLLRREVDWLGPESIVLMQDVYDHSLRIADLIESQRDLLTGLLEAHLAVVSNRMNDVMKKTSSYGAILLVSTLIAGIYGMNFRYMPELRWHYGYFIALATMGIATALLWVQFKKKGWL
ncbi:MAG: magnesium/cobalt transporter CorA [Acidimicrobiia bacterium]